MTECNGEQLQFHGLGRRTVVARFDGIAISSDGGALLLREVEAKTGLLAAVGKQFTDHRDPELIEHTAEEIVSQRILGLALGYADLNDHNRLRFDPLLAVAACKDDPTGRDRRRAQDRRKALASSSNRNRLELTPPVAGGEGRYKKIVADQAGLDRVLVAHFIQSHGTPPATLWLDLDATDDPLHGRQKGRFFHGYDGHDCYLPLYITCAEHVLCARLRRSDIDAAAGSVEALTRIVRQLRAAWPGVRIIRADSGFCREDTMAWFEAEGIDFVLDLAKNDRFLAKNQVGGFQSYSGSIQPPQTERPSSALCQNQRCQIRELPKTTPWGAEPKKVPTSSRK